MNQFSLSTLVRPVNKIVIMDIGASLLEVPLYQPLIDAELASLIGFEPNREECNKLQLKYGDPHKFFPYFIGDGQPATYYETNWFATGSLYKPNKALLEKFQNLHEVVTLIAEHRINTKALDDISEINYVDYIKIDVQGAELSVFKGAERLLKTALIIDTEVAFVELYEKQPLFADVDAYLRSRNFTLVKLLGTYSRALKPVVINNNLNTGSQHLWSDALYMKYWINPDSFTTDQLIKLAIIVHDIYSLIDFSYYLLSNLDTRTGSNYAQRYKEMCTQQAPSASSE